MVRNITDASFKNEVLDSPVPVMVDFWAPWCAPCRMVGPVIESIAADNSEKVRVCKLNVDENPGAARQYGIQGIPTVLVFRDGEMSDRFVGVQPRSVYEAALRG